MATWERELGAQSSQEEGAWHALGEGPHGEGLGCLGGEGGGRCMDWIVVSTRRSGKAGSAGSGRTGLDHFRALGVGLPWLTGT